MAGLVLADLVMENVILDNLGSVWKYLKQLSCIKDIVEQYANIEIGCWGDRALLCFANNPDNDMDILNIYIIVSVDLVNEEKKRQWITGMDVEKDDLIFFITHNSTNKIIPPEKCGFVLVKLEDDENCDLLNFLKTNVSAFEILHSYETIMTNLKSSIEEAGITDIFFSSKYQEVEMRNLITEVYKNENVDLLTTAINFLVKNDFPDFPHAFTAFRMELEEHPENSLGWSNFADFFLKLEEIKKGGNIETLDNAPLNEETKKNMMFTLDCCDTSLRLNSNGNDNAWYNKGVALRRLKKYDEAIDPFENAIICSPVPHAFAWSQLATIYMIMNEDQKAIEYFKESLEISPHTIQIRMNLAILYYKLRKYEDARIEIEHCINDFKDIISSGIPSEYLADCLELNPDLWGYSKSRINLPELYPDLWGLYQLLRLYEIKILVRFHEYDKANKESNWFFYIFKDSGIEIVWDSFLDLYVQLQFFCKNYEQLDFQRCVHGT